jgi:hypothetical protein
LKLWRAGLAIVTLAWTPLAEAQSAPPSPSIGWRWKPSVYLLGSVDESTDRPLGANGVEIVEASPAGNVGAGLDGQHHDQQGRLHAVVFGLIRSPASGQDRSFFAAGRVEGSRAIAAGWTLTFGDNAKLQRRPQLALVDFQRNEGTVGLEWRHTNGFGIAAQASDRRRALPELQALGFARQSAGMTALLPWGPHGGAEIGASYQHYDAPTVTGERVVISAEAATFGTNAFSSVRYAWFIPHRDRRPSADSAQQSGDSAEFGDIDRAGLLEQLAFDSSDAAVLSDSFFLDPLESDSDEWDFGRHKHVVAAFGSRRLTSRVSLSGFVRIQHRRGPNLLSLTDTSPFTDDRAALRATLRYQFSHRVIGLAQGSYLRTWSGRPGFDFRRALVALGLQVQF